MVLNWKKKKVFVSFKIVSKWILQTHYYWQVPLEANNTKIRYQARAV